MPEEVIVWHKWMGDAIFADDNGKTVYAWERARKLTDLLLCKNPNRHYQDVHVTVINDEVTCKECLEWLHA